MKSEINLLSPQAKTDRMHRIRTRRINAISDTLLICVVLITCSYGAAFWALTKISASVDQRADANQEEEKRMEHEIRDINGLFLAVDTHISQESLWTPLIPDVLREIPPEISITKLQLSETPRAISLVGKATQGSAIVQYQRSLEKLPWVDHVVAPLQNFAIAPDASVTFTIFRKGMQGVAL